MHYKVRSAQRVLCQYRLINLVIKKGKQLLIVVISSCLPQALLLAMDPQPQHIWHKDSLKALMSERSLLFAQLPGDVKPLVVTRVVKQQWYEEQEKKFVQSYRRNPDIPPTCSVENEILYSGNPLVHHFTQNLVNKISKLSSTDCIVESHQYPINILNVPAALGLAELIQQKCKQGANPNKIYSWPLPLDIAALLGHAQCVAALLQAGAQNYRWQRKCLAVGVCVNNACPKTEHQIFFNRTMQLPMCDEEGELQIGPIEVAALQGHVEILGQLLHHAPWNTQENKDKIVRFCKMCLPNHSKVIRTLVRAGWPTEEIIHKANKWTLLHYAVVHNRTKDARVLCSFGAKLDAKDCFGNTALKLAQNSNNNEMIAILEAAQQVRGIN